MGTAQVPDQEDANRTTLKASILRRGAVAQTYLEGHHVVYAAARGLSRVALWPPTAHEHFRLFPATHTARRQSQLKRPPVYPRAPTVFDLAPGDVLYAPPFWLRRIECKASMSLLLEASSPSMKDRRLSVALHRVGAPLRECEAEDRSAVAFHLLKPVLERLGRSPRAVASALTVARPRGATPPGASPCGADGPAPPPPCLSEASLAEATDGAVAAVEPLKKKSPALVDVLIYDLVEHLAAWAVGVDRAPAFWSSCLAYEPPDADDDDDDDAPRT